MAKRLFQAPNWTPALVADAVALTSGAYMAWLPQAEAAAAAYATATATGGT